MTLNQFHSLVPGSRVRLAGSRETGTVVRISKHTPSALVRWDCGGDIGWEEHYRLELA